MAKQLTLEDSSYNGNQNLRRLNIKQEWTEDQVKEFVKCFEDVDHFFNKYVKIIHVDKGIIPFEPRPFQVKTAHSILENRNTVLCISRQTGKCLCKSETLNIRHKKTKKIEKISIEEFYERCCKSRGY